MAIPRTVKTTPVARFKVIGFALLANLAATLAHNKVDKIQNNIAHQSGAPPIVKCETAPVKAVKVMMKTLVPTAVFNSYPKTLVRINSIIIPPGTDETTDKANQNATQYRLHKAFFGIYISH